MPLCHLQNYHLNTHDMGNKIITETSPEYNDCKTQIGKAIKTRTFAKYRISMDYVLFSISIYLNSYLETISVKMQYDLFTKMVIEWIKSADNTGKIKVTMSDQHTDTGRWLYICQIISPLSP